MPRNPNGPPRFQLSSIQYWMIEVLSMKASVWLIGRSQESDNTKLSIDSKWRLRKARCASHTRPSFSDGCAEAEGTADGMWQRAAVMRPLGHSHTPHRLAQLTSKATQRTRFLPSTLPPA
ncbi:hypothetical protein M422DRAFT_259738 [Sphaerobolus stellatus SS14]|uniref:Uncharacterized protein n=1 Tax=Sphaerobolus stellatus (strain SS14) TaxID=990650 RepID=A0A0C9V7V1_SPHS4|nr:hypothetical protein M422DRAFT_259738 [Sphaerobolus stellatus SS14]